MEEYILGFGASTSKTSINGQLVSYVLQQFDNIETKLIDLNDFEMPIYSIDREQSNGIHPKALEFKSLIANATAIVISFAEHNGSYSAAFKNIMDWTSRSEDKLWSDKPMLLLSTSPGARGGATVLKSANTYFPYMGAKAIESLSIPRFYDHFDKKLGITDPDLHKSLSDRIQSIKEIINL